VRSAAQYSRVSAFARAEGVRPPARPPARPRASDRIALYIGTAVLLMFLLEAERTLAHARTGSDGQPPSPPLPTRAYASSHARCTH
jgi:hypothetical protein